MLAGSSHGDYHLSLFNHVFDQMIILEQIDSLRTDFKTF